MLWGERDRYIYTYSRYTLPLLRFSCAVSLWKLKIFTSDSWRQTNRRLQIISLVRQYHQTHIANNLPFCFLFFKKFCLLLLYPLSWFFDDFCYLCCDVNLFLWWVSFVCLYFALILCKVNELDKIFIYLWNYLNKFLYLLGKLGL